MPESGVIIRINTIPESAKMDVKKIAKDAFQTAQGMCWNLEDFVSETWEKIKNSRKAKVALGAGLGIGVPVTAAVIFGYPKPAISQESEDDTCYPANADATLIKRIMESKQYSFELKVKKGETIMDAINGYATSFANGGDIFINDAVFFLTALGYDLNEKYKSECFVPVCYSGQGCDPQELITRANQGPIIAEAAPPAHVHLAETEQATPEAGITEVAANQAPTVSAGEDLEGRVGSRVSIKAVGKDPDKTDVLKYSWVLTASPENSAISLKGADSRKVSFIPDKPGQYSLTVKVDDGRGGTATDDITVNVKPAELDLLKHGMNPAAIFNMGLGQYLEAKRGELGLHVEAGPLFGSFERIDNHTVVVRDPLGNPLDSFTLEKKLETDFSGFYTQASARIGDTALLWLNFRNMTEDGNFSIEGEEAADYERNNTLFQLGGRAGVYHIPGKFLIAGDLFFGYMLDEDESTSEDGSYESKREMYGGGAGLSAAFRLPISNFDVVPGVGIAYHYYSGKHDDMHTLLVTRAGVYDIRWSELFGMSFDYTYRLQNDGISDKELDTEMITNRVGFEAVFGKKRIFGIGGGYTLSGSYEESTEGELHDRDGDIENGFDLSLRFRYPFEKFALGLSANYEQRTINFNDDQGNIEESIGSLGVIVEF